MFSLRVFGGARLGIPLRIRMGRVVGVSRRGMLLALLLAMPPVMADAIPGLFNTGIDSNGALLPAGSIDPHYRLIASADASFPGPNTLVVAEGWPIPPWIANGPDSKWIAPQSDQSGGNAEGDYIYRLEFDLTDLDATTARVIGRWTSDNAGTAIRLNGLNLGLSNDGNFSALATPFAITNGFVEGTNTLDFVVNNAPSGANPTGIRIELSGSADPLPPPGTPPTILTPPAPQSVTPGATATFSVRARGAAPMSYQWRKDDRILAGATTATCTILAVSGSDVGAYDVIVSNPWGAVTSTPPATLSLKSPSPAELSYEGAGPSSRRTGLAISEIMYHPAARADERDLEFIELYNSNPYPEDLGGWRLSGDWDYTFPEATILPGFGYLVLAASPTDIAAIYGLTGVLGGFTNSLPNRSGNLRLRKPSGAVVLDIDYSDSPPWPAAADGAGHSLVLVRPSHGEANPMAWAASAAIGGSPGAVDPVPSGPLESVVINEFLAHSDPGEVEWVELYNHSALAVDVSGCVLTDDAATNKFVIPPHTVLPACGCVHYDQAALGFALSAEGETLYLKHPSGARVIHAVRFPPQQSGVATGRYPDGSGEFQRLVAPTPGTTNAAPRVSPVAINELMYHPISGDDDLQYVELFNRGTEAVALEGWRLEDGIAFTFPAATTLPAQGYLVIARTRTRLLAAYPTLDANATVGDFSGTLAHGGERVALTRPEPWVSTNPDGAPVTNTIQITVDEVTYGTEGRWGRWADGGGSSLELIDPRSNHRLAPNWADSDESAKAPWTTVEIAGRLDHGHPAVSNPDQLQVFLLGAGEALLDNVEVFRSGASNRLPNPGFENGAAGWYFQGTHRLSTVTNDAYGGARALLVHASDRGNLAADRIRAPLSAAFSSGETATLRARVRWLRGWPEILLRLKGGHLEVVGHLSVPLNLGTPGAPNSRMRANHGPAITAVAHRPVLPQVGEPIRVTATVDDPDGLQDVAVRYRVDPATTLATVTMNDQGANGDAIRGDGVFTGVIPAQTSGTLIAFRIEATDRSPSPATAIFPADAPTCECLVRVGDPLPPAGFGTYRLWVTQATFNRWSAREKLSGENVDATFIYGTNRVCYNMGARYGGSPFSAPTYNTPTGNLCGYSLDFPEDDAFLGDTSLVLDYLVRDPTGQREPLMFWFLERLGLPNNHRRYVHLYVNGVRRGAIYEDTQRPGEDPLEEWFPDDAEGSLFKTDFWDEFDDSGNRHSTGVPNTLENFTTTGGVKKAARYRWCWEPRAVGRTANDFNALYSLVDAVNAPEPGYASALEGLIDLEHWMRTFCMNDLASYWDGFGNPNTKNTYLYKPQSSGWKLMSWDFDVGLGVFNDPVDAPLFPTLSDPALNRLYGVPAVLRHYWRTLDEALSSFFKVGAGTAIDSILDARFAAFQTHGVSLTSPDPIKSWIAQRRTFLQSQLAGVAATFAVNGPATIVTNRNTVVLTGTAPVAIETITINDRPVPVTWLDVTSWQILVPVASATTSLTIRGLDRRGEPVHGASRTLSVAYTGAVETPESLVVINEIMPSPSVPDAEYIEILNRSASHSFDLSDWAVNGLDYTFPPGSILTNQQALVLAKDRAAFGAAYGWAVPVAGLFAGNLQADGETLTLHRPGANAAQRVAVAKVRYEPGPPWPAGANGTGSSYQLLDPAQDNWRAGNWAVVPADAPTFQPQWVYFSTNGTASGSLLYLYLQSPGDVYLDDIRIVAGSVPNVGANLVANGGFEAALEGTWTMTANFSGSARTGIRRSGSYGLHLVASAAGTGNNNSVYQTITPSLSSGQPYALSFWYLQTTNGGPLTVRLTGSGLTSGSVNPAPPAGATTPQATPAAANSVRTNLPAFAPIWINEVQVQNLSGITNRAGQPVPWLELHNPTTSSVSLAGHHLARSYTNLAEWSFPAGAVLGPGEFRVVFADGRTDLSTAAEWHTGFPLPAGPIELALSRTHNGQIQVLDYLTAVRPRADRSWGSFPDGQHFDRRAFFHATPGAPNDDTPEPIAVFINEWLADNSTTLADPADNDFEDWFEIYNPGPEAVDLGGCYLTDTLDDRLQSPVPVNGHYVIPPGGFLLVWADSERGQNSTTRPDLHVSFKLDRLGEAIYLVLPDGSIGDSVAFGPQIADVSEGFFPDGGSTRFPMRFPTARAANRIANTAPVIEPIAAKHLHAGQILRFAVTAEDPEGAVQQLTFSLDPGAPVGAAIDAESGQFVWVTAGVPAPSTAVITVRVTDNGWLPMSASESVFVTVLPPPQIEARMIEARLRLTLAAIPGQTYQVQYTDNLADSQWLPLGAWPAGTDGAIAIDAEIGTSAQRYYRVVAVSE